MALWTIIIGCLLELVGIVGFSLSRDKSMTAWIPSLFGVVLLWMGVMALRKPASRKTSMHIAAGASLLGAVLAWGRLLMKFSWQAISDGVAEALRIYPVDSSPPRLALFSMLLMGLLCSVHVLSALGSFVRARMVRKGTSL